jgi:hypothetical protein
MSIECEWLIKRLDGSQINRRTTEAKRPRSGDGKVIDGIHCQVGEWLETPTTAPPDYRYSAKEIPR